VSREKDKTQIAPAAIQSREEAGCKPAHRNLSSADICGSFPVSYYQFLYINSSAFSLEISCISYGIARKNRRLFYGQSHKNLKDVNYHINFFYIYVMI
jgi:hypothetical protein